MIDEQGREMFLTPEAEAGAQAYVALGGVLLAGHRDIWRQAHDMATNVWQRWTLHGDRRWIALTYKHGQPLQDAIDAHPGALVQDELTTVLYNALEAMSQDDLYHISHHLTLPCPCFDGLPGSVSDEQVRSLPGLTKFLFSEGGLSRCHVEFDQALQEIKHA